MCTAFHAFTRLPYVQLHDQVSFQTCALDIYDQELSFTIPSETSLDNAVRLSKLTQCLKADAAFAIKHNSLPRLTGSHHAVAYQSIY